MKTTLLSLIALAATAALRADAQTASTEPVGVRDGDVKQRANLLTGITHDYRRDSVRRLVRSELSSNGIPAGQIVYALDSAGNRTAVTGGQAPGNYSMNPALPDPADGQVNQYTTTPTDTRTYDKNGNLIAINPGTSTERTFTYDFRNRLVALADAATGTLATYRYDCLGRRFEKVVTTGAGTTTRRFVFDGRREIEERNGADVVQATFVRGPNGAVLRTTRGVQTYFHHTDGRRNTTALTNAAGSVVERNGYDDFGKPQFLTPGNVPLPASAVGNVWLAGGLFFDAESGLLHNAGRSFEPGTGRSINGCARR